MADHQLVFDLPPFRPDRWDPENFLVSDANREAVLWLQGWRHWPAPALILCGPTGSGKTHLVNGFCARTDAIVIAATELTRQDPHAIAGRSRPSVIEDVDRFLDETGERPLLHLYNALAAAEGKLLLTARLPPQAWPVRLPDLRSRLNAAPIAPILVPDDGLLAAILIKLFHDRQLLIDDDVVSYLLPRIERSYEALPLLVDRLDRAALTAHRRLTVPFVRQVLSRERLVEDR